jgi:hypothetical protein
MDASACIALRVFIFAISAPRRAKRSRRRCASLKGSPFNLPRGVVACRRGDSRQYNARNRYYRSLAISGLTRIFCFYSPTGF